MSEINIELLKAAYPGFGESFLKLNAAKLSSPTPPGEEDSGYTFWAPADVATLADYYKNTPAASFSLADLSKKLGRTHASVALKASKLGLTVPRGVRLKSDAHRAIMSANNKARCAICPPPKPDWVKHPHPRGFLGHTHTPEARAAISSKHSGKTRPRDQVEKALKTRHSHGLLYPERSKQSWKAQWVELGGKRFYARSRWEANYARFLEWQKGLGLVKDWEHEPETFWFSGEKRGAVSYLPDFRVITKSDAVEYHEVKGWMDARSKTKISRMAKYHPTVTLIVIDAPRYKALSRSIKHLVPGWST